MTGSTSAPHRRNVRYRGYEMIVDDAEQIAARPYKTVGNWTFGQILDHLAKSYVASIDGINVRMPWPVRIVGGLLLKGRFLNKPIPRGFKFPDGRKSAFEPDATLSVDEALDSLRDAARRCKSEKHRSLHPLFGQLDTAEWDRFNLRHAELHMSFVIPVADEDVPSIESPIESGEPNV